MRRVILFVFLLSVGVVVGHFAKLVVDAGAFRKIESNFDGRCKTHTEISGPEDMAFDSRDHLLFATSDHRPERHGEPTPDGGIYTLATDTPNALFLNVTPKLEFPFHPHGMSLLTDADGTRIFVVNHRPNEATVEIFDWVGSQLVFRDTIRGPLLKNNHNDIAAVDRSRFYVTIEQGSEDPLMKNLETYTRIGRGQVLFFDGKSFSVKANDFSFANGAALSADGKILYVAETFGRRIRVFERNSTTSDLHLLKYIDLGTGPDNITVADDGSLWVGSHPNLFKLKDHSQNHSLAAPAQVLRVADPLSERPRIERVLENRGELISAASVAVPIGERFFVGSIFQDRALECWPTLH